MKLVRGIIREDTFARVADALQRAGAAGLTVTTGQGRGRHGRTAVFRGTSHPALDPVCVVEVIADDDSADRIARVMMDHAHTGQPGDGHVLVMAVSECYAVRTRWLEVA
jgi:nitrogen regulatory protein P-II 1